MFTDDNKRAVYKKDDTLVTVVLDSDNRSIIPGVGHYIQPVLRKDFLAYNLAKSERTVILEDLMGEKQRQFYEVEYYLFDEKGEHFVFVSSVKSNDTMRKCLKWMDLRSGRFADIWLAIRSSQSIHSISFDKSGRKITFLVQDKTAAGASNSIWYFDDQLQRARKILENASNGMEKGFYISESAPFFHSSGNFIFFEQSPPNDFNVPDKNAVNVDVWSYDDSVLQSTQLLEGKSILNNNSREFISVINLKNNLSARLEKSR